MVKPEVVAKRIDKIDVVAREVLGYADGARPFQRRVIEALFRGEDAFGVAATGQGKSAIFQIPAMVLPGLVLVLSPLVALMKDQVDKLKRWGIAAGRLSHDLPASEQHETMRRLRDLAILYVAPERLKVKAFVEALKGCRVSVIALDEAHVAHTWASFRPGYSGMGMLRTLFPLAPALAVTATADDMVEQDVVRMLRLRPGYRRIVAPPDRPNLTYHGIEEDGLRHVADLIRGATAKGSAIVYTATRRAAEDVFAELRDGYGLEGGHHYHAGLDPALRTSVQDRFMDGELTWMVATNAFGMGTDKANVRLVYHWHLPESITSYAQEAGRAGRDGQPSDCWLNISREGLNKRRFFIRMGNPPLWVYEKLWRIVTAGGKHHRGDRVTATSEWLRQRLGLKDGLTGWMDSALAYLEYRRVIDVSPGPTTHRLPIRDFVAARRYASVYRCCKVEGSTLVVRTDPDEESPVPDMIRDGVVDSRPPEEARIIRLGADTMPVTEDDIALRESDAEERLTDVTRFSRAKDKPAFLRAKFLAAAGQEV